MKPGKPGTLERVWQFYHRALGKGLGLMQAKGIPVRGRGRAAVCR